MGNIQLSIIKGGQRVIIHPETGADQVVDFADAVRSVVNGMGSIDTEDNASSFARRSLMTSNKTSITIPKGMRVLIGDNYYHLSTDRTLTLNDYVAVANRNGKDLYVYAIPGTNEGELSFTISLNSTVPANYTAANSRKIGGFHCLCSSVGTISGHPLSGYVTGDIIPGSVWDLAFRPLAESEGMVYDEWTGLWVDIYLESYDGSKLTSRYGGTIADGASNPAFHWYKFVDYLKRVRKRLPWQHEFMSFSIGSNQATNIYGSADPGTTGGHVDTANRRMISNIGCEDCCGVMWQWGLDIGTTGSNQSSEWVNQYDSNDDGDSLGAGYARTTMGVVSGGWDNSSNSGSRSSYFGIGQLYLYVNISARGVSQCRPTGITA